MPTIPNEDQQLQQPKFAGQVPAFVVGQLYQRRFAQTVIVGFILGRMGLRSTKRL